MLNEALASLASIEECASEANSKKRASEPAQGRSLGALVERCGEPIRKSVSLLQSCLNRAKYQVEHHSFLSTADKNGAYQEPLQERIAWYVVNIYIIYSISLNGHKSASISDAIEWFFKGSDVSSTAILALFNRKTIQSVEEILQNVDVLSSFIDLLPYILEPHGHVTRGRLECDETAGKTRAKKRLNGVFYTPTDVAEFMVTSLAKDKAGDGTWLDPSCGTGVFLREVLRLHLKKHPENAIEYCEKHLFGMDISTLATESCGFVLLADCLWVGGAKLRSPYRAWQKVVQNIVRCDSLLVERISLDKAPDLRQIDLFTEKRSLVLSDLFPGVPDGFTHIVMNPPYSKIPITPLYRASWSSYSSQRLGSSGCAALPFVEMMSRLRGKGGNAAAVLPLSVGTSTGYQFKNCRDAMVRSGGLWEFLFFDREPHALFGEDIKTRNVIIFHEGDDKEETTIRTSGLLRWTSRTRHRIFNRGRAVTMGFTDISPFIPKIRSSSEAKGYAQLQSLYGGEVWVKPVVSRSPLSTCIKPGREDVFNLGSTAYNFMNAFFNFLTASDEIKRLSQSPVHSIRFPSRRLALAGFAVLVSRLVFWLWHVEGDGFHVTAEFLKRLPIWHLQLEEEEIARLALLGDKIWAVAESNKASALNGGKVTYSFYCPFDHTSALAVEEILLSAAGLPPSFSIVLDEFIHATVSNKVKDKRFKVI